MSTALNDTVPALHCPIPAPRLHPEAGGLDDDGIAWLAQFVDGLTWDRFRALKPGTLAGLTMSLAGTVPALRAGTHQLLLLWAFDDLECDEVSSESAAVFAVRLNAIARSIESAATSDDRFARAFGALRAEFAQSATDTQLARWSASVQRYLLALAAETTQRAAGSVPNLSTYAALRIHNGAMLPSLVIMDFVAGQPVSSQEFHDPRMQALSEIVALLVGWDNDILTIRKETARGGADHNLVTVMSRELNCTLTEAMPEAILLRERLFQLYQKLSGQLRSTASAELLTYIACHDAWVSGHLQWAMRTARYREGGHPDQVPLTLCAEPTGLDPAPLPIESIAWWWDCVR